MRPDTVFDLRFQQERTAFAWERTAISGLVVGALMTRVGVSVHVLLGAFGLAQVCGSTALLIWAGRHYEDLHGTLRSADSPAHPRAARVVGAGVTVATVLATVLAVIAILWPD